jgi:hypothetical protein
MRTSCTVAAAASSAAVADPESIGTALAQWLPTGHRWNRLPPSRTAFSDARGTQIVV